MLRRLHARRPRRRRKRWVAWQRLPRAKLKRCVVLFSRRSGRDDDTSTQKGKVHASDEELPEAARGSESEGPPSKKPSARPKPAKVRSFRD